MKESVQIYANNYMALYDDGTLGISDGIGYLATLSKEETKELALALARYFLGEEEG